MNLDGAKKKTLDFLENFLVVDNFKDLYWISETVNAIVGSKTAEEVYNHFGDGARMMEYMGCVDAAVQMYKFLNEIDEGSREETEKKLVSLRGPVFKKSYAHLINKDSDQTRSIEDSLANIFTVPGELDSQGNPIPKPSSRPSWLR